jgi:Tfp pilus assembly PilM family ATPase
MVRRWLSSEAPIGCSLTARHVRLTQVHGWHTARPSVTFQERALPAEAVDDADRRNAALPKLIREMLKSGDFRGRAVVSVLPPDDVWYRSMRLAPMPDGELATAAHWVAAKELGVNAETFKTEALRVGTVREADHEKVEVVAVGANLKALGDHATMLTRAGLVPIAIDAAPCAAARILTGRSGAPAAAAAGSGSAGRAADDALLVIDINGRGTTMVVAGDGQVKFLRTVSGGLARVADLLAQRLAVPPRAAQELLTQPLTQPVTPPAGAGEGSDA